MQHLSIQSQVDTIKKATELASKSKKSALKFLRDAGIISDNKEERNTKSSENKKQ
jgi:hypothetical protein